MNSYGNKSPYHTYEFANKVVRKAKLDGVTLTIAENEISGKIFVEFSTRRGKLKLQRNFEKLDDAEVFAGKFKSADDLKKYFGLNP
jgi:hypothetical protein